MSEYESTYFDSSTAERNVFLKFIIFVYVFVQ